MLKTEENFTGQFQINRVLLCNDDMFKYCKGKNSDLELIKKFTGDFTVW